MNKTIIRIFAATAAVSALAPFAYAEDVLIKGTVTDVFGDRAVIDAGTKKHLVNFGPKVKEVALKSGDSIEVDGDLKKSGEVRAHIVTLADGRKVEVGKDKKTWTEWLLGDDKDDGKPFTVTDAKKVASDKGYVLTGEPVSEKKHFVAAATKDGKTVEIDIHRDGEIKEHMAFTADDAKKAAIAKGYDVIGTPDAVKKHFEMLGRKEGRYFEVHAHRDGEVKEARVVEKSDPKWGAQIP